MGRCWFVGMAGLAGLAWPGHSLALSLAWPGLAWPGLASGSWPEPQPDLALALAWPGLAQPGHSLNLAWPGLATLALAWPWPLAWPGLSDY
jgi:hypothetical protein